MYTAGLSQGILVACRAQFEDELTKEATWALHTHLHHVCFAADHQGVFTSTPRKLPEEE